MTIETVDTKLGRDISIILERCQKDNLIAISLN